RAPLAEPIRHAPECTPRAYSPRCESQAEGPECQSANHAPCPKNPIGIARAGAETGSPVVVERPRTGRERGHPAETVASGESGVAVNAARCRPKSLLARSCRTNRQRLESEHRESWTATPVELRSHEGDAIVR